MRSCYTHSPPSARQRLLTRVRNSFLKKGKEKKAAQSCGIGAASLFRIESEPSEPRPRCKVCLKAASANDCNHRQLISNTASQSGAACCLAGCCPWDQRAADTPAAAPQQGTLAASFPPGGPYEHDTRRVGKGLRMRWHFTLHKATAPSCSFTKEIQIENPVFGEKKKM